MTWVVQADEDELTEQEVVEQVGIYFTTEKVDHKCKLCLSRVIVGSGDVADCTRVRGGISLGCGTCDLWKSGPASPKEQIAQDRLSYEEAGYVETPNEKFPVICESCTRYDEMDEKHGKCLLFMKKVDGPYCCGGYSNPEVKQPTKTHISS